MTFSSNLYGQAKNNLSGAEVTKKRRYDRDRSTQSMITAREHRIHIIGNRWKKGKVKKEGGKREFLAGAIDS